MKLRTVPSIMNLKGKRVLLRVDWNIPSESPVTGHRSPEEELKIKRSIATLKQLSRRGAIVIVLTHLGRPNGRDPKFSTRRLVPILKRFGVSVRFVDGFVVGRAKPGSIFLLENVRFNLGEEKNDPKLAKRYASLGDVFVNDAFASYRPHASVVGIPKFLDSYAGPALVAEVQALQHLIHHPKQPFIAFIGGLKVSSKLSFLKTLITLCDRVYLGGAMSMNIAAARGWSVGASTIEAAAVPMARPLIKNQKLILPVDVQVTTRLTRHPRLRSTPIRSIGPKDMVVDVGPKTLAMWKREIGSAKTILWNGPVGIVERMASAKGSMALARMIAQRSQDDAFGVAGGSDTVPIVFSTKTQKKIDYVSTGGGALLEFVAKKGRLPSFIPLLTKS
ncbi:MAG: phosphoglycerate kinase [Candidatus Uhrbacteria bacterium]|nr:phosphoglycerate kinase [Candidatus Uhrbacteria bacterium]